MTNKKQKPEVASPRRTIGVGSGDLLCVFFGFIHNLNKSREVFIQNTTWLFWTRRRITLIRHLVCFALILGTESFIVKPAIGSPIIINFLASPLPRNQTQSHYGIFNLAERSAMPLISLVAFGGGHPFSSELAHSDNINNFGCFSALIYEKNKAGESTNNASKDGGEKREHGMDFGVALLGYSIGAFLVVFFFAFKDELRDFIWLKTHNSKGAKGLDGGSAKAINFRVGQGDLIVSPGSCQQIRFYSSRNARRRKTGAPAGNWLFRALLSQAGCKPALQSWADGGSSVFGVAGFIAAPSVWIFLTLQRIPASVPTDKIS
jgi:hypothetical protein